MHACLRAHMHIRFERGGPVASFCVFFRGAQGANIGKTAAQYAGWNVDVPAMQISRCCGSGLEAINLAATKIKSGVFRQTIAHRRLKYTKLSNF